MRPRKPFLEKKNLNQVSDQKKSKSKTGLE